MLRELALRGVDTLIGRLGYIKASEVPRMAQVLFAGEGMPYQQDFMASTEAEIQKLALTNPWVYANISLISRRVALGRLMIEAQDKKGAWTEVPTHDFTRIFEERPNPYMGQMFVWMYQLFWLLLRGECYWMQVPDKGGTLRQVYPLPANRIYPVPSTTELIAGFCYTPSMTGISKTLKTEHVIFNRLPNPFNYNRGLSPLTAYVLGLQTQQEAEKFDMEDYKQGLTLRHIISLRPEVSDVDALRYQREIDEAVKLSRRFMVTRGGDIKVAPITIRRGGEDSSENVQKLSREKADYIYGIPLGLRTSDATQANATVAERTFISDTIWPLMVLLSEDLTVQSVEPYYGEGLRAVFEDVRIPDKELIMKEEKQKWQAMTYDEVREQQGLKKYFAKEIGKQKFTVVDELIKMQFEAELASKAQKEAEPPTTIIPPEGEGPPKDDMGLEDEEPDVVPDAFIDEEGKNSEVYRWLEEGWLPVPFQLIETGSKNGSDVGYWDREGYLPGSAYVAKQSEVKLWAEGRLPEIKHLRGQHPQLSHGRGYAGSGADRVLVRGRDRAAQRVLNPIKTGLPPELHAKAEAIVARSDQARDDLQLSNERQTMLMEQSNKLITEYRNKDLTQKETKELNDRSLAINAAIIASQTEPDAILKQYHKDVASEKRALYKHYEGEALGIREQMANPRVSDTTDAEIGRKMKQLDGAKTDKEGLKIANEIHELQAGAPSNRDLLTEPKRSKLDYYTKKTDDMGNPVPLSEYEKTQRGKFRDTVETLIPEYAMPVQPVGININPNTDRENYAKPNMMMMKFSTADTYTHEWGHHFENQSRAAQLRTSKFYRDRTKGEVEQKLSDVMGKKGYRFDEVTKVDKFIHPYMGKKYPGVNTELFSMGFELMRRNPKKLARDDPEMFDMIYAIMKSG